MSKRYLLALLILPLLIFTLPLSAKADSYANIARAQNLPTKNPTLTQKRVEKQATITERRTEKRATQEAKLNQIRVRNLTNYYNNLIRRLNAYSDRLQQLIDRIETRLDKIEPTLVKGDINEIKEDLALAQEDLDKAKQDIVDLKDLFDEMILSDNPMLKYSELRGEVRLIIEQFKSIHNSLVKTLGNIRGLRTGQLNISVTAKPTESE